MYRIKIDPDSAYSLATNLKRYSSDISQIRDSISGSLNSLSWEVKSKYNIEGMTSSAFSLGSRLANDLFLLGSYIENVVSRLTEADRSNTDSLVKIAENYEKIIYYKKLSSFSPYIVPTDSKPGTYPRGPLNKDGDYKYKSNCTWYVAAAVKQNSNGLIDLNNRSFTLPRKGDAKYWVEAAQTAKENGDFRIKEVDKIPEPGSIFCDPSIGDNGHVMFVDKVSKIEKNNKVSYNITVSEENWDGVPFKGAESVIIDGHPEVRRWLRTINIPIDNKGLGTVKSNGSFIHLNYLELDLSLSKEAGSSAELKY